MQGRNGFCGRARNHTRSRNRACASKADATSCRVRFSDATTRRPAVSLSTSATTNDSVPCDLPFQTAGRFRLHYGQNLIPSEFDYPGSWSLEGNLRLLRGIDGAGPSPIVRPFNHRLKWAFLGRCSARCLIWLKSPSLGQLFARKKCFSGGRIGTGTEALSCRAAFGAAHRYALGFLVREN